MRKKQLHCIPTCAMPSSAAVHANGLISLQHLKSVRVRGRTRMFATAHVLEVVPRRMKYGERPAEERRAMMRKC